MVNDTVTDLPDANATRSVDAIVRMTPLTLPPSEPKTGKAVGVDIFSGFVNVTRESRAVS